MKREETIAAAGLIVSAVIYFIYREEFNSSSPLMLMLICLAGFLLSFRFRLAGAVFLFIGGLSLIVHPYMFHTTQWMIPGGILITWAGLGLFIKWWNTSRN